MSGDRASTSENPEQPDVLADPSTARPTSARRADIQGLRAVAVLMVVAFHADLGVPGGFTGVDVFFVISGFVIAALLLREFAANAFSFAGFYARRVRRILPASALTISVVSLVSIAAISPSAQQMTGRTGASGSLFLSNVLLARNRNGYFDVKPTTNPLLHIWSLSVEEQFYLLFPALLVIGFLLARRRFPQSDPRRVVAAVVGAVGISSFLLSWYTTFHTFAVNPGWMRALFPGRQLMEGAQLAFYLAPTRAWEFAVGALLAIAVPQISRLPRVVAIWSGLAGAAIVTFAALALSSTTPFPGTAALVPVAGTALLLIAGTVSTNRVSSALSIRPLTYIGDMSYAWYLWHWPFIVFVSALFPTTRHAALIGAAISIVPTWLSYTYVETRVRFDPRVTGQRAVTVAAWCVLIPLVCAFVLLGAPKPPRSSATRALLAARQGGQEATVRGCDRGVALSALPARCTWKVAQPRGTVVLLGDSNAGHFLGPAVAAAKTLSVNLTVATSPECPFVDLIVIKPLNPGATAKCRNFVTTTLRQVSAEKPSLVIVAASTPLYLTDSTTFRDPVSGRRASSPSAKAELWTAGLTRVLKQFSSAGIRTVVIHTVPQFPTWDLSSCAEIRVYLAPRSCGTTESLATVAAYRRSSLDADNRALQSVPGSVGVDFASDLCKANGCATNDGNRWVYVDGFHLSKQGALALSGPFADIIRANAVA